MDHRRPKQTDKESVMSKTSEITESEIEAWAKAPENKERAKALGLRLIKFSKQPSELLKQPSLGEVEDKAQRWAVDNQVKAKMLLMRLLKIVM
jgi:hypothetical protein